jgi:3-oxoacyl-[acyl-carrier-protein] synthase-3
VSRVTDFDDPLTAILFSDAAGALVVGRKKDGAETGFYGTSVLKTEYAPDMIYMWNGNCPTDKRMTDVQGMLRQERSLLHMRGGASVLRSAVNRMAASVVECLGFTMQDLRDERPELREALERVFVIPHQANGRIVDGLQQRLGLRSEQVYRTIYFAGNSSAATTAYTLDYAVREGNLRRVEPPETSPQMGAIEPCGRRLAKGDLVVLTAIGAGYLYGAVAFVHAY